MPALDGLQNPFLLLALRREPGDFLPVDDRLAGSRVENAGEDGPSVAAGVCQYPSYLSTPYIIDGRMSDKRD